jgi:hypothetical protein
MEAALQRHLQNQEIMDYRYLLSVRGKLMRGLDYNVKQYASLQEFLEEYRFSGPLDNYRVADKLGGWVGYTPLFYACQSGAVQVLKWLLQVPGVSAGVNFAAPKMHLSERYQWYNAGFPLAAVMMHSGSVETMDLLLDNGADPWQKAPFKVPYNDYNPLGCLAWSATPGIWLDFFTCMPFGQSHVPPSI